jgi:hypothetical protein
MGTAFAPMFVPPDLSAWIASGIAGTTLAPLILGAGFEAETDGDTVHILWTPPAASASTEIAPLPAERFFVLPHGTGQSVTPKRIASVIPTLP